MRPRVGLAGTHTLGLLHHDWREAAGFQAVFMRVAEGMPEFVVDEVAAVVVQVLPVGARAVDPAPKR